MEEVKPDCENDVLCIMSVNMIILSQQIFELCTQTEVTIPVIPYKILNSREMWYRFKHLYVCNGQNKNLRCCEQHDGDS